MITTPPISPAHILKGSPSPTSSTSGTGGKKTSRPPKGSKQFSSPLSNQSSSSSSIPPMTPNDQLPQQHIPSFKGPVIPPPTHFPYFPMNPMAMPNVPMMYAPINPIHMIPTTPPMFGMFPQPVIPNIPPPTTPHSHSTKVPTPIQPKPSTSPPPSNVTSKTKPKKKKRPPVVANRNNGDNSSNNTTSPIASTSKIAEASTSNQQKRKEAPTTSRSVHEHIISYLWELGLKDSAKILENDLNNPLLLNASDDRISSFVHNLSNEIERHSHVIPPSNKKTLTNEKPKSDETSIINTTENDSFMSEANNSNNTTTDKYNSENYLNILKQTTKSNDTSYKPTAEYVNERLENLEKALCVKEQKVEVFARVKEVEERMLKLDVNQNSEIPQQPQQSLLGTNTTTVTHHEPVDNFFDSFFEDDHFPLDNTDC